MIRTAIDSFRVQCRNKTETTLCFYVKPREEVVAQMTRDFPCRMVAAAWRCRKCQENHQ